MRSHAVTEATGLTYRQIDYWTRRGAIAPNGPGKGAGARHSWSLDDLERLRRLARVVAFWNQFATDAHGMPTPLVGVIWRAALDEVLTLEGDGCRLVVEP